MNKKILLSVYSLCALVLLSCCSESNVDSSDQLIDTQDPSMISFSLSTGAVGRSVDYTLSDLKESVDGLRVIAIEKDATTIRFEDNYRWNRLNWAWDNSKDEKHRWPAEQDNGFPLSFYSYFPLNMGGASGQITPDHLLYSPTIASLAKGQTDYMVSRTLVSSKPVTGRVSMVFKHILSKIGFNLRVGSGFTVVVQSIRIVNVGNEGRTYDLKKLTYLAQQPTSFTTSYDYRSYFVDPTQQQGYPTAEVLVAGNNDTSLPVTSNAGALMLLPQQAPVWDKSAFVSEVKKWEDGCADDPSNHLRNNARYHGNLPTNVDEPGMQDAQSWNNARIELVYRMYETATGADVIGYTKNSQMASGTLAAHDMFVRVGFPLDLSSDVSKNWYPSKIYTYTISVGTADATNGTLLEPTWRDEEGNVVPDQPVDNPATRPGEDLTPQDTDVIGFIVTTTDWEIGEYAIK